MPVFAADVSYDTYDFSDEAQQRFNENNQILPVNTNSGTEFSKRKPRREIKNKNTPLESKENSDGNTNDESRKDYYPEPVYIQEYNPLNTDKKLSGRVISVPAGEKFWVVFNSGVSSGSSDKGDMITAQLAEDWYYNNILLAPNGSVVYGTTLDAKSAGYAYGGGSLSVVFNKILTPDGNTINLSSEVIAIKKDSERAKQLSKNILIGTVSSLLLGVVFTALGGGNNWGRNMLIYGGLGAAAGGIRGVMTRGVDVELPDGLVMEVALTEAASISPYNE